MRACKLYYIQGMCNAFAGYTRDTGTDPGFSERGSESIGDPLKQ